MGEQGVGGGIYPQMGGTRCRRGHIPTDGGTRCRRRHIPTDRGGGGGGGDKVSFTHRWAGQGVGGGIYLLMAREDWDSI